MNTTVPISEARSKLPKLVDLASTLSQKTYITVKGKVKAALVNAHELETMEATLEILNDPETMKSIREGLEDIKMGRLVDWEDVKKELDL
jgi:PHD/YefM family antitoxin component YafN of YafNO toxin-antitoxin module